MNFTLYDKGTHLFVEPDDLDAVTWLNANEPAMQRFGRSVVDRPAEKRAWYDRLVAEGAHVRVL